MPDKDTLTLTLRIHDPAEKKDAKKSTVWIVAEVSRDAIGMTQADFIEHYIRPALPQFEPILKLK